MSINEKILTVVNQVKSTGQGVSLKLPGASETQIQSLIKDFNRQGVNSEKVLIGGISGVHISPKESTEINSWNPETISTPQPFFSTISETFEFEDFNSSVIRKANWTPDKQGSLGLLKICVGGMETEEGERKWYSFPNVPKDVFLEFKDSDSRGRYFSKEIKRNYSMNKKSA